MHTFDALLKVDMSSRLSGSFIRMHKKLPSFSFCSEPDKEADDGGEPRRRRSGLFAKLSGGSRSSRSPSPYAGRSGSRKSSSRSSSIERENGGTSDADSDSDGGALSSSERLAPSSSGRRYSGTSYESETSASELEYSEGDLTDEEDELSADEMDEVVLANTEANAGTKTAADFLLAQPATTEVLEDGPNIVKSPASPFATSSSSASASAGRQPRRRKSTIKQEFVLNASRPVYERNRCSITLTHGDPEKYMEELNESGKNRRRPKSYVVASDLSEESYYAIEWAIGRSASITFRLRLIPSIMQAPC